MAEEFRSSITDVATKLRELHRVLITAARRQYEQEHEPIDGSVALFNHLTQNSAFAWLGPLTSLVSDVYALLDRPTIGDVDAMAVRQETNRLLNPAEDEDATFADQLRAARTFAPNSSHSTPMFAPRSGALPALDPNQNNAVRAARSTWADSPTLAERRAARERN